MTDLQRNWNVGTNIPKVVSAGASTRRALRIQWGTFVVWFQKPIANVHLLPWCRKKPAADIPPTADIPPSGDIPPLPPTLPRGKPTQKTASSHSTTSSKLSHASLTKTDKTTPANKKLAAGS
ncbi:hypothetical protein PCANC_08880 [Puccinia coronata f. sp. avenae]|uniref:Uncharacterized protein n=1 Tax=Puccinia coronata f. sp. avenae TaxID=200324 RepID=A0A2N5VS51_9BASI|nr:hypothetical protein PCANC_08880 [Puccinia coronata f. sp. avenae]